MCPRKTTPILLCPRRFDWGWIMIRHNKFYIYIIEDKDGRYYTGHTKDINKRVQLHSKGRGAKYLKARRPLKLVFHRQYLYYKNALKAERRIKHYTRERKQELIKIFSKDHDK